MRARSLGLAFAALLVLGRPVPGHAQDAASKPAATPSTARTPTAAPGDAPANAPTPAPRDAPANAPRPPIAPRTAEPATTEVAKLRRHRRHARHHHRRYAHWQPFPVYWPPLHGR